MLHPNIADSKEELVKLLEKFDLSYNDKDKPDRLRLKVINHFRKIHPLHEKLASMNTNDI